MMKRNWSLNRMMRLGMLLLLAVAIPAARASEGEAGAVAKRELDKLTDQANEAIGGAGETIEAVRTDWADRFAKFAAEYPKTESAAIALINVSILRAGNNDLEGAAAALEEAKTQTEDEDLLAEIAQQAAEYRIRPGEPAPDFATQDLEGRPFALSDLRGKVVLIDFWATWCQPCLAAVPKLIGLYEKHREAGLEIVGVSIDEKVDRDVVRSFTKEAGMGWIQLFDQDLPASDSIAAAYGVRPIPRYVLIDREGTVLHGYLFSDNMGEAIEAALAAEPGSVTPAAPPTAPR